MFRGGAEQSGYVEPVELPVGESRSEVLEDAGTIPVLSFEQLAVRGPELGDEVHQLTPTRKVEDRIGDEFLVGVSSPDHRPAIEDRVVFERAAPQQGAVPLRHALIGQELTPHRRVDAVRGDGDGAVDLGG